MNVYDLLHHIKWMWHLHLFQHLVGLNAGTLRMYMSAFAVFLCFLRRWHDRQSWIACKREETIWVMWCFNIVFIQWLRLECLAAWRYENVHSLWQCRSVILNPTNGHGHRQWRRRQQNDGLILIVCYKYLSIPNKLCGWV